MAKKKLGLVLGAGAARGFAHIGVIKVLEENNIKPDYILGISMGAIVGAYYSLNGTVQGLDRKVKMRKRDVLTLLDFRRPIKSLIKGKKIRKFLKAYFKRKKFDDLKIPMGILTTDLAAGEEFIIEEGRLLDAVMASSTIPVIFPPVKSDGRLLIDGDYAQCNPVDLIRKKVDKIIYVDVMTEREKIKIKGTNIFKILYYVVEVKRKKILNDILKLKDTIVIRPNVTGSFNFWKFHESDRFILEGEKAARKKIKEIKKLINKK